ncbi:MAG: hypothetical protein Q9213_003691 [Squamulea squamosa]
MNPSTGPDLVKTQPAIIHDGSIPSEHPTTTHSQQHLVLNRHCFGGTNFDLFFVVLELLALAGGIVGGVPYMNYKWRQCTKKEKAMEERLAAQHQEDRRKRRVVGEDAERKKVAKERKQNVRKR